MLDFSFEPYKQEMIDLLKKFIQIKSVKGKPKPFMPYGKGLFDALMFVQSESERMDLECVNLFGHMAYVDYGYGDEMLGILVHIDVVPEGDGWTMPAFEGIEKDGKIYGRGAIDNKGPAIAALFALRALSDNCVQLGKKVRLIFGTDEESGWADMDFYKKHETMPDIAFSPDGEYPVINAEKGLLHISLSAQGQQSTEGVYVVSFEAGTRPNVVPNSAHCTLHAPFEIIEKSVSAYVCPIEGRFTAKDIGGGLVRIDAEGKSAHGSRPEHGVNAAASLLHYLGTLPLSDGAVEKAIHLLAEKIGTDYTGQRIGLDLHDEISGPLTLNLGTLKAENGKLEAQIDIRYPIHTPREDVEAQLNTHFSDLTIKVVHALPSHYVPEDSELITKLKEAYTETTGLDAYCIAIGGATYARAFKNAVTFGPVFPGKPNVEHGPDEYIEIDVMMKNAEVIADAVIRLCEPE